MCLCHTVCDVHHVSVESPGRGSGNKQAQLPELQVLDRGCCKVFFLVFWDVGSEWMCFRMIDHVSSLSWEGPSGLLQHPHACSDCDRTHVTHRMSHTRSMSCVVHASILYALRMRLGSWGTWV
jgi:hypothetical protein